MTPPDGVSVSEDVRQDLEEARARRSAFNFEMVHVPVGSVLTFTRNPNVTATVTDKRGVAFKGEPTSLSEAARCALAEMGLNWTAI